MQMPLFEWNRDLSLTIVDSGYAFGYRTTGRYRSTCCDLPKADIAAIARSPPASAMWRLDKLTFEHKKPEKQLAS